MSTKTFFNNLGTTGIPMLVDTDEEFSIFVMNLCDTLKARLSGLIFMVASMRQGIEQVPIGIAGCHPAVVERQAHEVEMGRRPFRPGVLTGSAEEGDRVAGVDDITW